MSSSIEVINIVLFAAVHIQHFFLSIILIFIVLLDRYVHVLRVLFLLNPITSFKDSNTYLEFIEAELFIGPVIIFSYCLLVLRVLVILEYQKFIGTIRQQSSKDAKRQNQPGETFMSSLSSNFKIDSLSKQIEAHDKLSNLLRYL